MGVPGLLVAVVDEDPATGIAERWVAAFGRRDPGGPEPLTPDAVVRAASIGKLFTDAAAMVLVERGVLDLDAPVQRVLPGFAPRNPFGTPVTLRHLMTHTSGLVREPPVGHYFDPSEPTLQATVDSLAATELVHAPGSAYKYSNPGVGVVGAMIAQATGMSFEAAVRQLVLDPLGLRDSDFTARADLVARQAHGAMWTYDGRAIPTPSFAFGYGPAANLRSTVADLAAFAASWFPRAQNRVLAPATLESMWQLPGGAERGCGLGFFVRRHEGHRVVGHDGAVYGFASALRAMPEQGLAVAVVATRDFANAVTEAVAERALAAALANRRGERLPPPSWPTPVGAQDARALAGQYRAGPWRVELLERDGELVYDPDVGVRTRLRRADDGALVPDDPLAIGGARRLHLSRRGILNDGEFDYVRDDEVPATPPEELLPLLGEYGWDHDVLVVYEDHGRLGVLIEWVVRDLPQREGPDRFRFPPGLYGGDALAFERDANGRVVAAVVGGARFPRRSDPVPGGFRVAPLRPVAELQQEAARGVPPPSPGTARPAELVPLADVVPGVRFDLRYARADNFLGTPVYPSGAIAMLQRPAAEALARVQKALAADGLGLCVFDAYRPWSVTKVFWEATPPALREFVADPANGSRHNRGCAVDLTLCDLSTGEPVPMPSDFDEFTPRAFPDYPGGTSRERWFRARLRRAMEAEGFSVYPQEWWHFDFRDWREYAVGNEPARRTGDGTAGARAPGPW